MQGLGITLLIFSVLGLSSAYWLGGYNTGEGEELLTTPSYPDDTQMQPLEIPYIKMHQFKPAGDAFEVNVKVDWGPRANTTELKVLKGVSRLFSNTCRKAIEKCTIGRGSYVNDMCGFARQDTCYDLDVNYNCTENDRRPSCLVEEECSKPEIAWFFNAACDYVFDSFRFSEPPNNQPATPPWDSVPWFVNQALKLSFLLPYRKGDLKYQCQKDYLECFAKPPADDITSYCGMIVDLKTTWGSPVRGMRTDCLHNECTAVLPTIIDAACTRSVINWNGPWFAGTRLQVAAAAHTSVTCQDQFVKCRKTLFDHDKTMKVNATEEERAASQPNYCTLVATNGECLRTGGACTRAETDALYDGACNSEQFNWSSRAVSIAMMGPTWMVVLVVMGLVVRSELIMD